MPQTPENKDCPSHVEPLNNKSGFSIANILDAKTLSLQEALKSLSKDLHISTSAQLLSQNGTQTSQLSGAFKETTSPGNNSNNKNDNLFQPQTPLTVPLSQQTSIAGSVPNSTAISPAGCGGAKQGMVPLTSPHQPVLSPAATAAALASIHPFILSCTPTEALMQQAGILKNLGALPHHATSAANPLATAAAGIPLPPSVAPLAETMINDPIAAAAFLKWYSPWVFLAAGASGPTVAGVNSPFYSPPLFSTGIQHLASGLKNGKSSNLNLNLSNNNFNLSENTDLLKHKNPYELRN